ncbi:META domain-containing protein [Rasiella rasia]|uniref:META domain-containing protein n=1 Tax=Rasiella rasia TaxID=2744027 RepID=A0A6G6GMI5_9FLAO|nr:META domain-containing protein [Rasiella rasia]QIE59623.1 META domain-containing protein [Rasiella rasia]
MRSLYITLALTAFLFTGCDETKKVIDVAGNVQLSGAYEITSVGAARVSNPNITINFGALDKSVRGNGGCNSFFGNYTLDLYSLNFVDIAATENYCDESIMTTERAIMKALNETGSFTYEDSILTLLSKTDRSVLLKAKKNKRDQQSE